ncbi:hypothetical protein LZE03_17670 [Klebsiella pneumoniae]|uniref:hypothetical protein n=1 Tax=Klebsiella pneumoniae TaxID=573 RepID=UPI001F4827C8|nr:hypothetical protein [Klebsiella pneumoniae]MCE7406559.1 hypothetical protein [Klebsiella pneumoniae]MEC4009614.1 hypothetical protein [Klebsiella pneumoniae]
MQNKKNIKRCIFCDVSANDVRITREHVLPKWMKKHIPHVKAYNYMSTFNKEKPIVRNRIGMSPFDLTISVVCEKCNNGWMSEKVETPTADILKKIIFSHQLNLDKEALRLLSLWAVKTAFIRVLVDSGDRVIPKSHYQSICNLEIPSDTKVLLGYRGNSYKEIVTRVHRATDMYGHFLICGIEIYSMVLVITSCNSQQFKDVYDDMILNKHFPDSTRCIWPIPEDEIAWPLDASMPLSINDALQKIVDDFLPIFNENKIRGTAV